jgi:F0F1-type ATP synthase membrane subunit c/vacuolar-type H+-ATPase subunit K
MLRRHERLMLVLFAAFTASVVFLGLLALTADQWWPERPRLEAEMNRSLAVILFSLGFLNVLLSMFIRVFAPTRLRKDADVQSLANLSRGLMILAFALCETPALFGLAYVLLGGDILPAAFLFSFSATSIAAHYAARIRP